MYFYGLHSSYLMSIQCLVFFLNMFPDPFYDLQ